MKSFRHILLSILLIASFVSNAQLRTKIQDYTNVATLQSETLISKDNDKIYVKSINTIFAWNVNSTATHDGINVIKQTNITTGRFLKVNPETGATVRYGTAIPVIIATDRKGDSYILTDTGINTGIVQSVWVYDATIWKKTVTITDPVIDFAVNADPNTTLTTFSPNLANTVDVLYRSTIDGSLWSSNGTIYTPSVASTNRTIQTINATGVISAWNSTIQIGATPLTANIVLTLPTNVGSKFRDIIFKRLDNTAFTVTIVANGVETAELTTPLNLNTQFGALTIQSISTTKSQQISNIGTGGSGTVLSEYGENNTITNGQTTSSSTLSAITNGTITLPSAGVWNIGYNIYAWQSSSGQTISFVIKDILGNIVANSAGSGAGSNGNANAAQLVSQNVNVATTAPTVYTIHWATAGTGTATLVNTNPTTIAGSSSSKTFFQKVSGYLSISGSTGDFISVTRTAVQNSGIGIGSPILFTTKLEGNLGQTLGIFSLPAGKTYQLIGNCGITSGDRGLSVRWRNLTSGLLLGTEAATLSPISGNGNSPFLGSANAILTTTVATTVQLEIVGFLGGSAPSAIGFQADQPNSAPYASIVQIGATPTVENQAVNLLNFPTGGALQATPIDPYVLGFNVAQTTASQVLTIPSPVTTTVNRILYVCNTGTSDFKIGTITVGVAKTVAYIWNGVLWSNFSTEVVGAVASTPLTKIYGATWVNTANTPSNASGHSFTVPVSGTYIFDYVASAYSATTTQTGTFSIRNGTTVLASDVQTGYNNSAHVEYSYKVEVTLTAGVTYNAFFSTGYIRDASDYERIYYKQSSGYLPISGSSVDVASSIASATSPTGVIDVAWTGVTGTITNNGTLFTLIAGNTYRLESIVGLNFNTGSTASATYQFVDASNNTIGANIGSVYNQVAGGTGDSPTPMTAVTYTPTVTTQVKVRILSSGAVGGATINRANLSIIQVGSTASIVNQAVNVANLATGGALQATPIDPYVLGFNVAQSTAGQSVSIPSPASTSVNRILYINNTGSVDFTVLGISVSANKSVAFIWNGTIWSAFSAQTSGAVLYETVAPIFTPAATTLSGTTSAAATDIVSIAIPSAGSWNINWNMRGVNPSISNSASSTALFDANNVLQAGSEVMSIFSATTTNIQSTGRNTYNVTTTGSQVFKIRGWSNSTAGGLIISDANGRSWVSAEKVSGNTPVTGQTVETTYAKQTTTQGTPSNGTPLNFESVDGTTPITGGTTFTLTPNRTYYLQGAPGIMSGANARFAAQFYNLTTGAYIGSNASYVSPSTGASHTPISGIASAKITPTVPTQIQLRIIELSGTAGIIGGQSLTNTGAGTGSVDSPSSANWMKITQEGSSAYSILNTYVGASSTTAGVTGGVPVSAAGDQAKMLMGDGTWMTSTTAINNITPATVSNTINNTTFAQNWNWDLTSGTGLNLSEGTAQTTSTGTLLTIGTLATSLVKPLSVLYQGNSVIDIANTGVQTFGNTAINRGQLFTSSATNTNGVSVVENSLTSGNAVNILSFSTAKTSGSMGLNVAVSGSLLAATQTTFGAKIANTHTGTTQTNIGLQVSAGGGINNYALIVPIGYSGFGTSMPSSLVHLASDNDGATPTLAIGGNNFTPFGGLTTAQLDLGGLFVHQASVGGIGAKTSMIAGGKSNGVYPSIFSLWTSNGLSQPTEKLTLTGIGNLGLGQLLPINAKLEVFGNSVFGIQTSADGAFSIGANIVNMGTPTKLLTNAIATPETALRLYRAGTSAVKYNQSVDFQVGSYSAGLNPFSNLNIRLGGGALHIPDVDVMTLQSDVKVGIGTLTPLSTLQLANNLSASTPTFTIGGTNTTAFGTLSAAQLDLGGLFIHQAAVAGVGAKTSIIGGGKTTGSLGSIFGLYTTPTGGSQALERFTLIGNGNAGFGTITPSTTVEINNNTTSTNPSFSISGDNTTAFAGLTAAQLDAGGFFIHQAVVGANARTTFSAGGKTTGGAYSSMAFQTTPTGGVTPVQAMLIHQSGNVGFNTGNPLSGVSINNSLALKAVIVTTAYTILATDCIISCQNTTAATITLPDATLFPGRIIMINREENSSGVLTLASVSMMQNNAGAYAASITQAVLGTWGSNCQYVSVGGRWKRIN